MLEVNISKKLNNFKLNSKFSSDKGILSILGPSGSGKSMTLRLISGLLTPDTGSIILNGKIEHSILLELFTEEGAGTLIKENKTQEDIT